MEDCGLRAAFISVGEMNELEKTAAPISVERESRPASAPVLFWRWRYAKYVTGASATTSPLCIVLFVSGYSDWVRERECRVGFGAGGKHTGV